MNPTSEKIAASAPPAPVKEKIIFEARPLIMPAIVTFENLTLIGIVVLAVLFSVVFHVGVWEIVVIALLFVFLAFPSFQRIFMTGATTYVLTNRRLVIFSMGIKKKEQSIPLDEIISAEHKYSGLQRLYGAGDIIIKRKLLHKPVRLRAVSNCKQLAEQIMKAVKNYRK